MERKEHLYLKDLWEYLNRYTYLPRLKDRDTLVAAVRSAISGMLPGPFGYAERFDEQSNQYVGLAIQGSSSTAVTVDEYSLIVDPKVAAAKLVQVSDGRNGGGVDDGTQPPIDGVTPPVEPPIHPVEKDPTRFQGTVFLSSDRPARDMGQIVEAIIEQLSTMPGADVTLKLEIDAEVPSGLDRAKVRTLMENANTLNFTDKSVR